MTEELVSPAALAEIFGTTTGALAQMRYRGIGPKFIKLGSEGCSLQHVRRERVACRQHHAVHQRKGHGVSKVYTEADLAAAWESGYWHGTSHEGPLNDAAVAAINPYRVQGTTPAKLCTVALKTEKAVTLSPKSVTASEPNL